MADEATRSSLDIVAVRDIAISIVRRGNYLSDPYSDYSRERDGREYHTSRLERSSPSAQLFGDINSELVARLEDWEPNASLQFRLAAQSDIALALEILDTPHPYRSPVVPVVTGTENAFEQRPLFDVFNPRAWLSVTHDDVKLQEQQDDPYPEWRDVFGEKGTDRVALVPRETAFEGFLTLFADSMRAAGRLFKSHATNMFTVHSNSPGFQVEYYHQYNYSPVVFGTGLTSPVSAPIAIGHYHFQGWRSSRLTQDPGVYFAGPGSWSAHVRTF